MSGMPLGTESQHAKFTPTPGAEKYTFRKVDSNSTSLKNVLARSKESRCEVCISVQGDGLQNFEWWSSERTTPESAPPFPNFYMM
ncbi:hypothetical protein TNCV_2081361 [Trichonephila clavipes]|nr:hypothetical protein TNCV_2081361 [Trichonephila clavipes]